MSAIVEDFLELVQIETHSRQEAALGEVVEKKLKALGCQVEFDKAGEKIGGNCGNLIARLPGLSGPPPILFSCHLDRVDNHGRIKPKILEDEGVIVSDGTSILAADDVSGICAVLEALRRLKAEKIPHGDIELIFSVAEEVGLLGALNLDYSGIKSKMAYVLDTSGPVGAIINQAPTQYTFKITLQGKSAHAGMEPEKGLSALRVGAVALSRLREGRLSPRATSNFGTFKAGKADNIVCELAEITGEARSTDAEELAEYLAEVKKVFTETADEFGAGLEISMNLEYSTFKVDEAAPVMELAKRAMKNMGLTPQVQPTGGGSDGNHFNSHGIAAVGISPGYEAVHTPRERQSIAELAKCAALVLEIVKEAAKG